MSGGPVGLIATVLGSSSLSDVLDAGTPSRASSAPTPSAPTSSRSRSPVSARPPPRPAATGSARPSSRRPPTTWRRPSPTPSPASGTCWPGRTRASSSWPSRRSSDGRPRRSPTRPARPWPPALGGVSDAAGHGLEGAHVRHPDLPDVPAPNAVAASAIAAATTRLGMPYLWGATGPNRFDCSGLMQWAYAQAGVPLPRTSRAQYAALPHVSLSDLPPGDLRLLRHRHVQPGDHPPRGDVPRRRSVDPRARTRVTW